MNGHALYKSRLHALIERGLLGATRTSDIWNREADTVREELTPLGMALLKIIDAADYVEWAEGEQLSTVEAMQQSLVDIVRIVGCATTIFCVSQAPAAD